MKILKLSDEEMTTLDKYLLTLSPSMKTVNSVEDGTKIEVNKWCLFEDTKDDDHIEILSFMTPEKQVYCCQSNTFKKSFFDIQSFMGDIFTIEKISGKTKNGRGYVNCVIDISSF